MQVFGILDTSSLTVAGRDCSLIFCVCVSLWHESYIEKALFQIHSFVYMLSVCLNFSASESLPSFYEAGLPQDVFSLLLLIGPEIQVFCDAR